MSAGSDNNKLDKRRFWLKIVLPIASGLFLFGVIDQEFYLNPDRPWPTLAEYLHWYNYERIHLGKYLQGLTPMEKYLSYLSKSVSLDC